MVVEETEAKVDLGGKSFVVQVVDIFEINVCYWINATTLLL